MCRTISCRWSRCLPSLPFVPDCAAPRRWPGPTGSAHRPRWARREPHLSSLRAGEGRRSCCHEGTAVRGEPPAHERDVSLRQSRDTREHAHDTTAAEPPGQRPRAVHVEDTVAWLLPS